MIRRLLQRLATLIATLGGVSVVAALRIRTCSAAASGNASALRGRCARPRHIVADEPTSTLDASIQAQILNLFKDLQQQIGTAYVFISHSLSVVRHVAHDVMVMYFGRAVEQGPRNAVLASSLHPYTQALAPPAGCAFHTRCTLAGARCRVDTPRLRQVAGCQVACHVVADGVAG